MLTFIQVDSNHIELLMCQIPLIQKTLLHTSIAVESCFCLLQRLISWFCMAKYTWYWSHCCYW